MLSLHWTKNGKQSAKFSMLQMDKWPKSILAVWSHWSARFELQPFDSKAHEIV